MSNGSAGRTMNEINPSDLALAVQGFVSDSTGFMPDLSLCGLFAECVRSAAAEEQRLTPKEPS
jgi:hypothetical protein